MPGARESSSKQAVPRRAVSFTGAHPAGEEQEDEGERGGAIRNGGGQEFRAARFRGVLGRLRDAYLSRNCVKTTTAKGSPLRTAE